MATAPTATATMTGTDQHSHDARRECDYNSNGEGDIAAGNTTPKHLTRQLTATWKDAVTVDSEPDGEESGRCQTAAKAERERENDRGHQPWETRSGSGPWDSPAKKAGIAGVRAPLTN